MKVRVISCIFFAMLHGGCSPPEKPSEIKNYFLFNRVKREFATPFKKKLDKHIDLFIPSSSWRRLVADLPASGKQNFVPATLQYKDRIVAVDLRLRGRQQIHWARRKKSYRIRIKGQESIDGKKVVDIVVPKTFFPIEPVSLSLAKEFGLHAPAIEYISYSVNNRFMGVGYLTEPMDDQFLKIRNLKGTILAVDPESGTNDNNESPAWEDSDQWQRVCGAPILSKAQKIIDDLEQDRFSIPYNVENWARFLLFQSLVGTYNFDSVANTRVFYGDEILPVVWDVFYWTEIDSGVLLDITTPMIRKIVRVPEFQKVFWEQAAALLPRFRPQRIHKMIEESDLKIRETINSSSYSTALSYYSFLHPSNFGISSFYLYDSSHREIDLSKAAAKQAYEKNYQKIKGWLKNRPKIKVVPSPRIERAFAPKSQPYTVGVESPRVDSSEKRNIWDLIVRQK